MKALETCVFFTGILSTFSHCVSAIVRGPQITDVEFAVRGPENGVFTGHVYRQIPTGRRMQCAALCRRDALTCRSFNYFSGSKICELNDAAATSYPHELTTAEGCLYYEKIIENFGEAPDSTASSTSDKLTTSTMPETGTTNIGTSITTSTAPATTAPETSTVPSTSVVPSTSSASTTSTAPATTAPETSTVPSTSEVPSISTASTTSTAPATTAPETSTVPSTSVVPSTSTASTTSIAPATTAPETSTVPSTSVVPSTSTASTTSTAPATTAPETSTVPSTTEAPSTSGEPSTSAALATTISQAVSTALGTTETPTTTEEPSTIAAPATQANIPSAGQEGADCSPDDSYYYDTNDCALFYQCTFSNMVQKTCEPLYFNTDFNICDHTYNVPCPRPWQN